MPSRARDKCKVFQRRPAVCLKSNQARDGGILMRVRQEDNGFARVAQPPMPFVNVAAVPPS